MDDRARESLNARLEQPSWLKDPEAAITCNERAIEIDPRNVLAYADLAVIYSHADGFIDLEKAAQYCHKGYEVQDIPTEIFLTSHRGPMDLGEKNEDGFDFLMVGIRLRQGRLDDAREYLGKMKIYFAKYREGNYPRALERFDDPEYTEWHQQKEAPIPNIERQGQKAQKWSKIGNPVYDAHLKVELRGRAGNPPFTTEKNALLCVACGSATPLSTCSNCGSVEYTAGLSPDRVTGIFCASCSRGFTSFNCRCGCENPVNGETVAKKSGCFIVTAATSTDSWEVVTLCKFRDDILHSSTLGSWLVSLYERASPPIARVISPSRCLQEIVRRSIALPAAILAQAWLRAVESRGKQLG